ncbi:hypothetical protein, partial [Cylindrospermopsis raciborskii]|uniref:hypothetical protein n=1 Tax=Cylindrospermopsis raciborskii TaxID=77022 RepID=UPI0038D1EA56
IRFSCTTAYYPILRQENKSKTIDNYARYELMVLPISSTGQLPKQYQLEQCQSEDFSIYSESVSPTL